MFRGKGDRVTLTKLTVLQAQDQSGAEQRLGPVKREVDSTFPKVS